MFWSSCTKLSFIKKADENKAACVCTEERAAVSARVSVTWTPVVDQMDL